MFTAFLFFFQLHVFAQSDTSLVLYLPMDGNLKDASGKENDGKLTTGEVFATAKDRDGNPCAGDFSNIWFNVSFNTPATSERSLSFWVKRNSNAGDYIFESGSVPLISRVQDSIKIDLFHYDRTGSSYYLDSTKWYHMVWTMETGGLHKIYVNAILKHQETKLQTLSTSGSMLIGGAGCSLDDLRMYERALPADDVAQLFSQPSSCMVTVLSMETSLQQPKSPLLFACDLMGRPIPDLETYTGLAILHYQDGRTVKVMK